MEAKKKTGKERLKASKERKKELNRERAKRFYAKKKAEKEESSTTPFPSHQSFKRALNRVKDALPQTPEKKAKLIETLIESPRTKNILVRNGVEEQAQKTVGSAVLKDVKEAISMLKHKRSNDARTAVNIGISMICGENVASRGLQKDIASELDINRRRIAQSLQHRRSATLTSKPWSSIERKTRNDATPEEVRRQAYDFWQSPGISRPTGNKRDVAKKRVGPKEYIEHEKYILEKTQTEIYNAFKQQYPDIKMGQRYFENCKPFFVIPARMEDRNSCCCRLHVEIQMVFKSLMGYRRKHPSGAEIMKQYSHLSDLIADTLCPLGDKALYHNKSCIERECNNCGTNKLTLLPEEKDDIDGTKVQWQKFEYVEMGEKRKLKIIFKETPVCEMVNYFLTLLEVFPAHQFRASWQQSQMKKLIEKLPENQACAVHDYSENYTCQHQDQIQSLYYGQTQVSIHVTVLHRHAVPTDDVSPASIVTEHLFVISPDVKHDSHSVHHNRELLAHYFKDIGCKVEVLHEWTDGCSAQYKSRHCMGDVSFSVPDFGFLTIRNYFETSHAKGPQDGAGANLKHKCDMAVIKRQVVIQNAEDLYCFAKKEFQDPTSGRYQSENVKLHRRVYFYVNEIERNRPNRLFKEVEGNRAIHSIIGESSTGKTLKTRSLSCYCTSCLKQQYELCENRDYVPEWTVQEMVPERSFGDQRITRSSFEDQIIQIADLACKDTVVAVASGDIGEDYYLLKVTADGPEHLNHPLKDDWGAEYPSGAKVLKGLFLDRCKRQQNNQLYRILKDKVAVVYAATVRYICQELEYVNDNYVVTLKLHEEILDSLDGF